MKQVFLFSLFCIVMMISCKKGETTTEMPLQPVSETVKYILISNTEFHLTTRTGIGLTCYNSDYSIKWQRKRLGSIGTSHDLYSHLPATPGCEYANGVVYFSLDSLDAAYKAYNMFYAIDITTGKDIWKKTNVGEYMQSPVVRNDTLYCNFQTRGLNYIAAFNAKNGLILWKHLIPNPLGAGNLKLDGNTLYFVTVDVNKATSLNALDLTNKILKWKNEFGLNHGGLHSSIIINDHVLYIRNAASRLLAIDKNTGATKWTHNPVYRVPMFGNDLIYFINNNNEILGLNADGVEKSRWTSGLQIGYRFDLEGQNIYFTGKDAAQSDVIISFNALNSNTNWRKNIAYTCNYSLVAGKDLFVTTNAISVSSIPYNFNYKVLIFDKNSGLMNDSIGIIGTQVGEVKIVTAEGNFIYGSF